LLEPVLKDTYGTIVYQEQIMQVFQVLADYSLGQADQVRRMMGKKDLKTMEEQRGKFIEASAKHDMKKEDAEKLEIRLIEEYETRFNQKGYNIESGGNVQKDIPLETRKKISEKKKGFKHSDETKKKISQSKKGKESPLRGKKMSEEAIKINSISHIGQKAWNKGRPWTDEEKAKCGGKAVVCVELNKVYRTAHEAGKDLNLDFSSICKCVKGKVKTVGGYHWKSAEEWELPNG
jgi:hypothetical protein